MPDSVDSTTVTSRTRRERWEQQFSLVQSHIRDTGRAPDKSIPYLVDWIRIQRVAIAAGKLPEELSSRFCELLGDNLVIGRGVGSAQHDTRWKDTFGKLKDWVDAHGAAPRRRSDLAEERALADWLARQRGAFKAGKLAPEHAELLEAEPGVLDARPMHGPLQYAQDVAAFYRKEGRMPRHHGDAEAHPRYRLKRLREAADRNPLATEVLQVLDGIPWQAGAGTTTAERLAAVQQYAAEHGRLPFDDPEVLRWVGRIAEGKSEESREAHRALQELEGRYPLPRGGWSAWARSWYAHCDELEQFINREGTLPRGSTQPSSYGWLRTQRLKLADGALDAEQAAALRAVLKKVGINE